MSYLMMKLAVLGATGRTGEHIVEQALEAGNHVRVLVRNPSRVKIQHSKLEVIEVDIFSEESLRKGMEGCDAVISCLGGRPSCCSKVTLYSDSMVAITSAMRACGINRLIAMSSAYARPSPGEGCCVACCLRGMFLRTVLADCARMEDYLQETANDLAWTVVKPPGLQNKPMDQRTAGTFEGEYVPDALMGMPRANVAKFMLDQLCDNTWNNKAVAVAFMKDT